MKTHLHLIVLACLMAVNPVYGTPGSNNSNEAAFTHAKQQINAMLAGDKQLSF